MLLNSELLDDELHGAPARTALRPSLSARFLIVAAGVIMLGMTLLGFWVSSIVERSIVHHAGATIAVYVETLLEPYRAIFKGGLALDEVHVEALDGVLKRRLAATRVRELKIWSRDGLIIYSTDKSRAGKRYPLTANLSSALRGNVEAQYDSQHFALTNPDAVSRERLFEVYIPLRDPGSPSVIAVAEIYESADAVFDDVRNAQIQSALIVATIGASMTAALYLVVRPASRLIEKQQRELTERVNELSSSLYETQELKGRLLQANRKVAEVQERVLQELSAELHDGPIQLVALALLQLDNIAPCPPEPGTAPSPGEPLAVVRERLDEALAEIRALAMGFALPDLANRSLLDALTLSARNHERRTGTKVEIRSEDHIPRLPETVVGALYRFVQEGLTNVFRHAATHGQAVEVECKEDILRVTVADLGPGMAEIIQSHEKLGLRGMRSRIEALGGTFSMASSTNGTRVAAEFGLGQLGVSDG
jgi:signal transduction histidine kinase